MAMTEHEQWQNMIAFLDTLIANRELYIALLKGHNVNLSSTVFAVPSDVVDAALDAQGALRQSIAEKIATCKKEIEALQRFRVHCIDCQHGRTQFDGSYAPSWVRDLIRRARDD
jgi:hypothetical protein